MNRIAAQPRGINLHADAAEADGRICQALAGNPARRLKNIGVSGRYGQTTTSYLVASVLAAGGHKAGVLGTLGYFDGDEWGDAVRATPPPSVLANWMARMAANGCSHSVLEVSNVALDQQRLAGVELDVACIDVARINNVRRDRHASRHASRRSKARLLDYLAPEGFAIVNIDQPGAERLLAQVDGPVLTVGVRGAAEITAVSVEQRLSEQTFLLSTEQETVPVRTPLIGAHNIIHCLMAAAVGLVYSIDLPTIVRGLEALQRIPGRLERIECGQPFGVFVDQAHTPAALSASLQTLRAVTSGRLICVFGAEGGRDKSKRALLGHAAEAAADLAVVTSGHAPAGPPEAAISQIVAGFDRPAEAHTIVDRRQAIVFALEQARPGDCLLIAGKAHAMHPNVRNRWSECDDRQVARGWLYQSAAARARAA